MTSLLLSRASLVWLLMVAATIISWDLSQQRDTANSPSALVIVIITFIKVRLVISEFMGVRHAPIWMRLALDGWLVTIATLIYLLL